MKFAALPRSFCRHRWSFPRRWPEFQGHANVDVQTCTKCGRGDSRWCSLGGSANRLWARARCGRKSMRHQAVLEKAIVTRIIITLKNNPHVVVRKRHGTAMGMAGDPDLYGTINGRHFEIEVKRPNDSSSQLRELQTQRVMEWKAAGAIAGVARSVEEALVILGLARSVETEAS